MSNDTNETHGNAGVTSAGLPGSALTASDWLIAARCLAEFNAALRKTKQEWPWWQRLTMERSVDKVAPEIELICWRMADGLSPNIPDQGPGRQPKD